RRRHVRHTGGPAMIDEDSRSPRPVIGRGAHRDGPGARDERRGRLLVDAVLAIGADLSLDGVLTRIVRTASELVGARYAALGVLGPPGADRRLVTFVHHGMTDEQVAAIGALPAGH